MSYLIPFWSVRMFFQSLIIFEIIQEKITILETIVTVRINAIKIWFSYNFPFQDGGSLK